MNYIPSIAAVMTILQMLSCADSYRTVFEKNRETGESIRIYKFDRQAVNVEGKTEWEMSAEESYIFRNEEKESKIVAYNFHFIQYSPETGEIQTNLTAGRGEIDYDNKKVYLSEKVSFKESASKHGEAESMVYDMDTKIISSDKKVILYEGGRVTRCLKGIEVDKENDREVCKGPALIQRQQEGSEQKFNDIFD